jgi:hypothetical protein
VLHGLVDGQNSFGKPAKCLAVNNQCNQAVQVTYFDVGASPRGERVDAGDIKTICPKQGDKAFSFVAACNLGDGKCIQAAYNAATAASDAANVGARKAAGK